MTPEVAVTFVLLYRQLSLFSAEMSVHVCVRVCVRTWALISEVCLSCNSILAIIKGLTAF